MLPWCDRDRGSWALAVAHTAKPSPSRAVRKIAERDAVALA